MTPLRHAGFSLVELMTVVAVIGVFTGIMLPWFSGVDRAEQAKDMRNAQSFSTISIAATAAGVSLIEAGTTKLEAMRTLVQGVTITRGTLRGRTFRIPNVKEADLSRAARYLSVRDGQLIYHSQEVGTATVDL